jgi:hypothetical protein
VSDRHTDSAGQPSGNLPGRRTDSAGQPSGDLRGRRTDSAGQPFGDLPGRHPDSAGQPSGDLRGRHTDSAGQPSGDLRGRHTDSAGQPSGDLPGRHPDSAGQPSGDLPGRRTDSAGQPWAGRHFDETAYADDDGAAPPLLLEALRRFRNGDGGRAEVVDAVRGTRLLVPLLASLAEAGTGRGGRLTDKSAELALVTVGTPDGRTALPAFTSVTAMQAWNPRARPVPAASERVALAARAEGNDVVILDPTSPTEFALRRPALDALAQEHPWQAPEDDPELAAEFARCSAVSEVLEVRLASGDPEARLLFPEVQVDLTLIGGLDRGRLDSLLAELTARWAASALIAARVDSLAVRLRAAEA